MTTLLRFRLIPVSDQDQQLAKSLYEDPRQSLQNFTAGLIRECLTTTPPIATQAEYNHTLRALAELVQSGKATEAYVPDGLSHRKVPLIHGLSVLRNSFMTFEDRRAQ
jgi:hypothetical protein